MDASKKEVRAMAGTSEGGAGQDIREQCLAISLQSVASTIRASDGRDIPFSRALLTVTNVCSTEVIDLVPHASLGQEGGTDQDVTHAFTRSAAASIPAGGSVSWDVYDLLLPAHVGTASKVHMFGYRAALNWRFDLAAWAEYRLSGPAGPVQTPVARWALRWIVPDPSTGAVALAIEEGK
jgi:hypothetical protein